MVLCTQVGQGSKYVHQWGQGGTVYTTGTRWYCVHQWDKVVLCTQVGQGSKYVHQWDKVVLCTPVGQGGNVYTNGTRWYCVHQWDMVVICTPVGHGGTVYTSGGKVAFSKSAMHIYRLHVELHSTACSKMLCSTNICSVHSVKALSACISCLFHFDP